MNGKLVYAKVSVVMVTSGYKNT